MHEEEAESAQGPLFKGGPDIGCRRVRQVERRAVVRDDDDQRFRFQTDDNLDPMRLVIVVSVANGIGQDLV